MTETQILKVVTKITKLIENLDQDQGQALDILKRLNNINMTWNILWTTRIVHAVIEFSTRSSDFEVKKLSQNLVEKWKSVRNTTKSDNSSKGVNNGNAKGNESKNDKSIKQPQLEDTNATSNKKFNSGGNFKHVKNKTCKTNESKFEKPFKKQDDITSDDTSGSDDSFKNANNGVAIAIKEKNEKKENIKQKKKKKRYEKNTPSHFRIKYRNKIIEALRVNENLKKKNIEPLANALEECIFREFNKTGSEYKYRMLSRFSNLKDPNNPDLRSKFVSGSITPARLAVLSHEEMASDAKKKLRALYKKE